MSRTVTSIYSSRAEAETARALLQARLGEGDVQILGHADREAIDRFRFSKEDHEHYVDALAGGDYLLCAHVSSDEDDNRLVQILTDAISNPSPAPGQSYAAGTPSQTGRALFVSDTRIIRGGARVNLPGSVPERPMRERSAASPSGTARVNRDELLAAGLFRDRTIEASEMGEVPVIKRSPIVREEVVLRKTVSKRTEIIKDTVRRTATEITELDRPNDRDPSSLEHRRKRED
jgi:hypothetical protein